MSVSALDQEDRQWRRAATVSERRVLTDCPEAKVEGFQTIAAALSGPGVPINCPEEEGGLQTKAAAVPGLGVATNRCSTPSNEEPIEQEEAGLPPRLEHKSEQEAMATGEAVDDKDWAELRPAVGDDVSHSCGSFLFSGVEAEMSHKSEGLGNLDLVLGKVTSGACTLRTAIKILVTC